MIELPDQPFFVASQYHPEFKSRPLRPSRSSATSWERRSSGPATALPRSSWT